jgi:acylphosphatase
MSESAGVRLVATVFGTVQGVGYRYYAEGEANRLGVSGYVRNKPDGSVEVVAEGERKVLEGLLALLRRGPSPAEVRDVEFTFSSATGEFYGFNVRSWR